MSDKSKMIRYMKHYLFCSYVGNGTGFIGAIKQRYWDWRLNRMPEGEVIERYYMLTDKNSGVMI